jgi:hypothetical protein
MELGDDYFLCLPRRKNILLRYAIAPTAVILFDSLELSHAVFSGGREAL